MFEYHNFISGLPAYSGLFCETLICANEPVQCKDQSVFTKNDCAMDMIPFYCPTLCGKCQTTTTTTTTITTTVPVTPKNCATKSCLNGGQLNSNTCLCECKVLIKLL